MGAGWALSLMPGAETQGSHPCLLGGAELSRSVSGPRRLGSVPGPPQSVGRGGEVFPPQLWSQCVSRPGSGWGREVPEAGAERSLKQGHGCPLQGEGAQPWSGTHPCGPESLRLPPCCDARRSQTLSSFCPSSCTVGINYMQAAGRCESGLGRARPSVSSCRFDSVRCWLQKSQRLRRQEAECLTGCWAARLSAQHLSVGPGLPTGPAILSRSPRVWRPAPQVTRKGTDDPELTLTHFLASDPSNTSLLPWD